MSWLKDFLEGKGWLLYGSIFGGILGALALQINFQVSPDERMLLSLPMGIPTMVGLGMIGGLAGGVIGSFVTGLYVHEGVVFSLGVSLGIGLLNGFIVGVLLGLLLGCMNLICPGCLSTPRLIGLMAITIIIAVVIYLLRSVKE
ncbi:MAG: hypothetical protein HN337_06995 [Deltaproteobacteria bacterium]|jgi:hypothetical protein|nr:hypothetical protein [Deltaproteobacteria bacterium]